MPKQTPSKPTDGELAILRVLWRRGPGTVRNVFDELNKLQKTGYTTALKMMQIMTEKGLLERDDTDRSHVYSPRLAEDDTQRQLVSDLLERAFGGSAKKLVLQALSTAKTPPRELAEIKKLLDSMEGE
jgi:predicted transcriptional regulator